MLGEELERAIEKTWLKLRHQILSDPLELQRRLARRRLVHLNRPPRAWCIAIRASDRRITPAHWVITPEHAMDKDHPEHPYEPIEHEVLIQKHALSRYCRPVWIARPGQQVTEVAEMLGVSPAALRRARHAGFFRENFYKNLGGRRGKPIPVLFNPDALDPAAGFYHAGPHPVWGSMWHHLPELVPDDFEQAVIRRPHFARFSPRSHHPDDPAQFTGYRWLCPSCKKEVRTIFYPLPVRTLFDCWFTDPAIKLKLTDADLLDPPPPTFACRACHRVHYFISCHRNGWNHVISYVTGGMLYGSEVEKPATFRGERKRARSRQLFREAKRRDQVLRRLLNGWTTHQIARDLLMSVQSVYRHLYALCSQERVKGRRELCAKLGSVHAQPGTQYEKAAERREAVLKLVLEGVTRPEMARRLATPQPTIDRDVKLILRKHGVRRRGELAAKMGVELPARYAVYAEVKRRYLAGESTEEIALGMGLTYKAVGDRVTRIRREERVRGRKELMEKIQNAELTGEKLEIGK